MTAKNEPQKQAEYVIDAENVAEMARLTKQAHLMTGVVGLFPPQVDPSRAGAILDIGCGPGEWVLGVAELLPGCQITGIDSSIVMTEYAQVYAQTRELPNAHFRMMDARQPLDFPDASFDIVHMRLITTFLTTSAWPLLLLECFRLLRPGGIICSTEFENLGISTSSALMRYNALFIQALRQAGCCFTPEGESIGITMVQTRLLRDAGFSNVKQKGYINGGGKDGPLYTATYENYKVALKLMQPFIVHSGLATQEELDMFYARALHEIQGDDFCGMAIVQTAWGEKPL